MFRSLLSEKDNVGSLLVNGSSNRNSLGMCLPLALRYRMIRDCCAGVVSRLNRPHMTQLHLT